MKILYLTHTCPFPPNRGDRIRCYYILDHLSKRYELTLVYPVFNTEHQLCQEHLQQYCKSVFPVKLNTIVSSLSCIKSLFSKQSLSLSFFSSRKLAKIVETISPDVVLADCSTMAQYAVSLLCPKIVDFVDIDSQKWQYFSSMTSFPHSLIYLTEAKRLSQFEKLLVNRFDYCIVTSSYEKSLLSNSSHITVIPNGVDQQYFAAQNAPSDGSIIFTGVMDYFPNSDAALHFHYDIFPLIKRQVPSVQFIIAGMHPTKQIRKLADRHTTVTGFVPDIREYLSKAAVCVVPLRIAMGIQNKILEAMAMGVPVVATSVANRGINAAHGREILVADDPESFAAATTRLLNDQSLRQTITKNAKEFTNQNFCWEKNLSKLDELIVETTKPTLIH